MIRTDLSDIDDETFLNVVLPAEEKITNYVMNNFIYDYLAYYIATKFNMDAMWSCSMKQEINSALCTLCNFEEATIDYKKVKDILLKEHLLKITHDNPMEIENIKK